MKPISLDDFVANDTAVFDEVLTSREGIVITREVGEPVVVLPLADYESELATAYLLGSAASVRRVPNAAESSHRNTRKVTSN